MSKLHALDLTKAKPVVSKKTPKPKEVKVEDKVEVEVPKPATKKRKSKVLEAVVETIEAEPEKPYAIKTIKMAPKPEKTAKQIAAAERRAALAKAKREEALAIEAELESQRIELEATIAAKKLASAEKRRLKREAAKAALLCEPITKPEAFVETELVKAVKIIPTKKVIPGVETSAKKRFELEVDASHYRKTPAVFGKSYQRR